MLVVTREIMKFGVGTIYQRSASGGLFSLKKPHVKIRSLRLERTPSSIPDG